jgi:CheY-like chemotaxis protein
MALGSDAAASRAAPSAAPGGGERAPAGSSPGAPPEELVEAQLKTILEATQTSAGAVCLFDQHQELLRLAVEIGLSDEGCRRLRTVRRGAATSWDMPLHSLLNRRAYLIESAAKNRYVPPLVDDVAAVRAVACIPLYDGSTAVGSLVLVSCGSFGERQVRQLEQPVRELVATIAAMRKRVSPTAPAAVTRPSLSSRAGTVPLPSAVAAVGPIAPGVKTAPAAPEAGSSIEAAVQRARAELERLRARVAESEETAARERARATAAEQQRDELSTRAAEQEGELERLRAAIGERTSQQQTLAERVRVLSEALESARTTEAALRSELAGSDTLRSRVAELEEAGRSAVNDAEAKASAALAAAEARTAAVAAEIEALRTRTVELEAAHHEAEGRVSASIDDAAEWQRRCEANEAELANARISLATQSDQAEAIARQREQDERDLATARTREAALEARLAELGNELEHVRHEGVHLRTGFAHLESLIQTGVDSGDVPTNGEATQAFDLSEAGAFEVVDLASTGETLDEEVLLGTDGPGLDIEEVGVIATVTPASEPAAPAPTAAADAAPEGLVVIDVDQAWTAAAGSDMALTVLPPGDDIAARVAERNPERLLVNLAAPNALGALAAIRAADLGVPCFGCIGLAGQSRGLALGRLEVMARPIDPDALLALLSGAFSKGTRVVTAGADVDGLISLRQALARLGASVSMAWDAKQASDLLAMVHPDVAVIDLELPPRDGCAVVARLGVAGPPPVTVIIPKAADTARNFAAIVAEPELAAATVPYKGLLGTIASRPLIEKKATALRR